MKRLVIGVFSLLLVATASGAAGINPAARDWYVEQKRIHKLALIAAAERDSRNLYVAERLNSESGHKLKAAKASFGNGAFDRCENFHLAVYSLIKSEGRADARRADQASNDCWDALAGR